MRLLRRNTVQFRYMAYHGEIEHYPDGQHTGDYAAQYDAPVTLRGNLAPANGMIDPEMYGVRIDYTHLLIMDKRDAPIDEYGLIEYGGETFEIVTVERSLNFTRATLRRRPRNHAVDVM